MAECRGCGAQIVWAETPDGKKQPFDREPNDAGNRILLGRGPRTPPVAVPVGALMPESGIAQLTLIRYMPHHATCPEVKSFRPAPTGSASAAEASGGS